MSQQTHEALNTVLGAIIDGEYDDALDRIAQAIRSRMAIVKDQTARRNVVTLTPGAKVRLQGLSPKYLNGMTGIIVEDPLFRSNSRKATLSVALDGPPIGRFGKTVRVPANCLVAVE